MSPTELSERLWDFAARVGRLVDALPDSRLGRHVAGQLIRCGTAPAPNYDEGRAAESRADFIHKLGIVLKELVETSGWLRFTVKANLIASEKVSALLDESSQLEKIIASSRLTARRNRAEPAADSTARRRSRPPHPIFRGLDHVAIVVPDTEQALAIWRDRVGLTVLESEVVNDGSVRLTHLDLGNSELQLVEPLTPGHPLHAWLTTHGPGLHHLCLNVEDVAEAQTVLPQEGLAVAPALHEGTMNRRALFLDRATTQGVQLEVIGQ